MNLAEKFIKQQVKTIEVGGIPFKFRKVNPEETYLMNKNLNVIRAMNKLRKEKEEEEEDCEDCPKELRLNLVEIQKLTDLDTRVVLTRCIIEPKIVLKPLGEQSDDEIPFELIDNKSANDLFNAIQQFSMEVFEGVSLDSFPDERSGENIDGDEFVFKHPPEPVGGELSPEDESAVEDEIGRILREGEEDGIKDKGGAVSGTSRKTKTTQKASRKTEKRKRTQQKSNK